MLIGESNVAIDPAIGGYGVADIYLGEFSPQAPEEAELHLITSRSLASQERHSGYGPGPGRGL